MELISKISMEELKNFHTTDRYAYARLTISLGLDPLLSMIIVAFWNWLERLGFRNFVKNSETLSDADLYALANEAVSCLRCLECFSEELFPWIQIDVPQTGRLAGQVISLGHIFPGKEFTIKAIMDFVNNVCARAFADIVPRTTKLPENENHVQDPTPAPENNRTLFITFSKGHPISKQELEDLITRKFGYCVETIYMKIDPEPLFARVVVHSTSDITKILGDNDLVKFSINGKDVWVRRFVIKCKDQPPTAKQCRQQRC
ncbi:hypothetical protein SLE2022_002950 [Rubroshorea leprosula]